MPIMTRFATRVRIATALGLLALLAAVGATALSDSTRQPDKLVILSTTDVKGKTSPCG
jgi:hypothetical protein